MDKLNIVPLKNNSKQPDLVSLKPYFYQKYTLQIDNVNKGVIMGKTSENLVVLDIDDPILAKELKIELNSLTYLVQTGKMGLHIYIRLDTVYNLKTCKLIKDKKAIGDFKAEGYVVAANSIHPNGNKYKAINDLKIAVSNIDAISKMLGKFGIAIGKKQSNKLTKDELLEECCPEGEGNNRAYLAAIYYHHNSDDAYEDLKNWNMRCCPDNPIQQHELKQTFDSAEGATLPVFLRKTKGQKREDIVEKIVKELMENRDIYSDAETRQIFENKGGYLLDITNLLKKDIREYKVKEGVYRDILFRLESECEDIPKVNDDFIVFKNGIYSISEKKIVKSNELAAIGLPHITYFENAYPEQFYKTMFGDIPEDQHSRLKKSLQSILRPYHDSRISVIYGESGVGKSTGLAILQHILGPDNAMSVNLEDFIKDRATQAKVIGKLLVIFQDMPSTFKGFTPMKVLTGETTLNIRGFQQDAKQGKNTAKFFASANYLFDIPKIEQSAMFSRRLSLITNTRKMQFEEDATFAERVAQKEGDFIISWLLQIDNTVKYEDKSNLRKAWNDIQSPQIPFLKKYYEFTEDKESTIPITSIKKHYEESEDAEIDIKILKNTIYNEGYSMQGAMVQYMKRRNLGSQEVLS
uniref:DNA primase n=1 Tax=Nitrosopumivirus cobalaminus TaxID=3158414 RepID=A0AAU7N622_9VIRU